MALNAKWMSIGWFLQKHPFITIFLVIVIGLTLLFGLVGWVAVIDLFFGSPDAIVSDSTNS